jgi:hypothetical protein
MKKYKQLGFFSTILSLACVLTLFGCSNQTNEQENKSSTNNISINDEQIAIPDSVIQFLVNSSANDFSEHQPPTVIDIRNVKAGYISSGKQTIYLICGEFLSQEKKVWEPFETTKTSGYEQNIGNNVFCKQATFEKVENSNLSDAIKSKLAELKKSM